MMTVVPTLNFEATVYVDYERSVFRIYSPLARNPIERPESSFFSDVLYKYEGEFEQVFSSVFKGTTSVLISKSAQKRVEEIIDFNREETRPPLYSSEEKG